MDELQIMLSERRQITKEYIVYDSVYIKHGNTQTDPQWQKVEVWLPRAGGGSRLQKSTKKFGGGGHMPPVIVMIVPQVYTWAKTQIVHVKCVSLSYVKYAINSVLES